MQRQSRMILARLRSTEDVEASVTLNGPDIGQALDERFVNDNTLTDAEAPRPSFRDILFTLRDELTASGQGLGSLDVDHVEDLRNFLEQREERNQLLAKVYTQLGVSRRTIEGLFEPADAFVLAGIEGPISRNTDELLKQADLAIERLKSPDMVLPEPKFKGITVDPETLVQDLEPEVERLRAVNKDLRASRRAVQKSRQRKNEALDKHDHTFLWIGRALEGYYQLAGEAELAQQIRPSTRRPGRRAAEVANDDEPGETPEAESPEGATEPQSTSGAQAPAEEPAAVEPPESPEEPIPDPASSAGSQAGSEPASPDA